MQRDMKELLAKLRNPESALENHYSAGYEMAYKELHSPGVNINFILARMSSYTVRSPYEGEHSLDGAFWQGYSDSCKRYAPLAQQKQEESVRKTLMWNNFISEEKEEDA